MPVSKIQVSSEEQSSQANLLQLLCKHKEKTAVDAARSLLRNGVDPNFVYKGQSALHVAVAVDHLDMVQLLMHFGADPRLKDRKGTTPLDLADGKTKEFLDRLLQTPRKKRTNILRRIFFCHSGKVFNQWFKKRKERRERASTCNDVVLLESLDDFPRSRHDPLPSNVVVEDDPLPGERDVIPGLVPRTPSPPIPDTGKVTTKRGARARPRTRVIAASDSGATPKTRSRSLDANILRLHGTRKTPTTRTPRRSKTPDSKLITHSARAKINNAEVGARTPRTPNTRKNAANPAGVQKKIAHSTPRVAPNGPNAAVPSPLAKPWNHTPKALPPPRPKPSAPPLEQTPFKSRPSTNSDADYLTANESIMSECEERLKKLNLGDPEVKRVKALTDQQLRAELKRVAVPVGPINNDTRELYQRKLIFKGQMKTGKKYSYRLEKAMGGDVVTREVGLKLDRELTKELCDGARCFVYLLVDPRKLNMKQNISFASFIDAVFYVGKATGERPIAHLIDAKKMRNATSPQKTTAKLDRIDSIWNSGAGVVVVDFFKNVSDKMALCGEACIIMAIGDSNLTNVKGGEFYGRARAWDLATKVEYGTYLLQQAVAHCNAGPLRPIRPEVVPDQLFGAKKGG